MGGSDRVDRLSGCPATNAGSPDPGWVSSAVVAAITGGGTETRALATLPQVHESDSESSDIMVFFNYALRKLNAKIVYYGPGLCGKTTNLQWIHDHFEGGQRGKMISLATEGDRTIFFDLLPIDIGTIRGMEVTLQLYTVPGQVHYNSTRQLVLRGADGVVFVADSQRTMQRSNEESIKNLEENLLLQGLEIKDFPHVIQFNKRDLRDLLSVDEMDAQLNAHRAPIFEGVATDGVGVQETLEGIVKLVMRSLKERYEPMVAGGGGPRPPAGPSVTSGPWPATAGGPRPPVAAPRAPVPTSQPSPSLAPPSVSPRPPAAPGPAQPQGPRPPVRAPVVPPEEPLPDETPTAVFGRRPVDAPTGEVTVDREPDLLTDEPTDAERELRTRSVAPPPSSPVQDEPTVVRDADDFAPVSGPGSLFEPPETNGSAPFSPESPPFAEAETDTGMFVPDSDDIVIGQSETPAAPSRTRSGDGYRDEIRVQSPFVRSPQEESGTPVSETPPRSPFPVGGSADDDAAADDLAGVWPPPPDTVQPSQASTDDEVVNGWDVDDEPSEVAFDSAPLEEADVAFGDLEAGELELAEPEPRDPEVAEPEPLEPASPPAPAPSAPPRSPAAPVRPPQSAPEAPAAARGEPGGVDDLMAKVLGSRGAGGDSGRRATQEPAQPDVSTPRPSSARPPRVEPVTPPGPKPPPVEPIKPPAPKPPPVAPVTPPTSAPTAREPVTFGGDGDPFSVEDERRVPGSAELMPAAPRRPERPEIGVQAHDNQLQVRLQGTGAIAESGEVRELDIQVPVPGSWVGNRRVTLQLRLTLVPATDDEEDGADG